MLGAEQIFVIKRHPPWRGQDNWASRLDKCPRQGERSQRLQNRIHVLHRSLATMSVSLNTWNSSPSTSNLLPPYSGSKTLSPTATLIGILIPASPLTPGPTATTVPSRPLDWAASGMNSPPLVFVSAATR